MPTFSAVPGIASPGVFPPGGLGGGGGVMPVTPSVVQQVQGGTSNDYGLDSISFNNTAGNFLVAFIGWEVYTANIVSSVIPAVNVTDSAGNLWRQIGITSSAGYGSRCAIWVCPNAQALKVAGGNGWISVSLTGWASALTYNIAEIANMPNAVQVDFTNATFNDYAFTLNYAGTTDEADIAFLLLNAAISTNTVTSAPAGWTALATSSNAGADSTGCKIFPYWLDAVPSATNLATSITTGIQANLSGLLCTISATASPPPQLTPQAPRVVVEAAFGALPGDASQSVDYTWAVENIVWTDISTRCMGGGSDINITITRGRQYELDQEEAGELDFRINNVDGAFTPGYTASPYYSNALNTNMSFELGLAPWTAIDGATAAQSTTQVFSGTYSCLVTPNGSTANPGIQSEMVPINQNYTYTLCAQVNIPTGFSGGVQLGINWYNASHSYISSSFVAGVVTTAGWNALSETYAAVAGAAYAQCIVQMEGTPTTAQLMYVDEAALVWGTNFVQTGLVRLNTPVRVTAWWQGIQYGIGYGYVERWPQAWPDMPQWGFSNMVAVDALGAAASSNMFSCMQGEVLVDNPEAYFPCNEQYNTSVSGATPAIPYYFQSAYYVPADANGFIAINYARNNNRTGVYGDGNQLEVNTGQALNLLGDENTAMGTTDYQAQGGNERGPGMVYQDYNLPNWNTGSGGATYEFWFSFDSPGFQTSLLTVYGVPSTWANTFGVNGYALNVWLGSSSTAVTATTYLRTDGIGNNQWDIPFNGNPVHVAVTIPAGSVRGTVNATTYINGVAKGVTQVTVPAQVKALTLGPGRYSYDGANFSSDLAYLGYNYVAGHVAAYNYQLSPARIKDHYMAGFYGWAGTTAPYRFAQILTWGTLGLKRGGVAWENANPNVENTQISEAYQLSGSSVSDAVNAVAQAEGGRYFTTGNGSLIYLQRWAVYNQPSSATFGDNATSANGPLNTISTFNSPVVYSWSPQNSTLTASQVQTYAPYSAYSMLLTPTSSANAVASAQSSTFPVQAGQTYRSFAWAYSPTGWSTVGTGFSWLNSGGGTISSSSGSTSVPANVWSALSYTIAAPSNATAAVLTVAETGNPGTSNILYVALAGAYLASPEIPFEKDVTYDYDNSILYSEVTATQQRGPSQLLTVAERNQMSETEYFRRSSLNVSPAVVSNYDVYGLVNWNLQRLKQPQLRMAGMTIHASANPYVAFPAVLNTDISDIVTTNRRPLGGAVISELGIVEQVKHEIGPIYWKTSYQISPYSPNNEVLMTDISGQDTLGTQTLPW